VLLLAAAPGLESWTRHGFLGLDALGWVSFLTLWIAQALVINRETGNRRGEGTLLGNLGNRYADLGQTARAIDYYGQALVICRELGARSGEAINLCNLGNRYADLSV